MTKQYIVTCPPTLSQKIEHGLIIYATGILPSTLKSYEDALNPACWASHHQPFSAVILHDSGTEVLLIRDHLGLEPLYFTQHAETFRIYVASNLPDLFSLLPQTPALNEQAVIDLFSTTHTYSDQTLYQGVFRVEPGHRLHFQPNGRFNKQAFWALSPQGETLIYQDSEDYVAHFSALLNEAIQQTTLHHSAIAAEFSAGLDSTSVYCAAHQSGLNPKLFMHAAPSDSDAEKRYQTKYETAFIAAYPEAHIERIHTKEFDVLSVFDEYAQWFNGPAPYLFYMFANPIHRAVEAQGYQILLSGFGGDQGVSTPAPLNFFIPELIAQKDYALAFEEILGPRVHRTALKKLKALLTLTSYLHPHLHRSTLFLKKLRMEWHNLLHHGQQQKVTTPHPYARTHYPTLREAEYALLQGTDSHEVRMRIEYSSLVGKQMGFDYRYPLLYPKLLEFFLSIPRAEKRHQHMGRHLIRRYLKQFIPNDIFAHYLKKEGLDIVPATMTHYQERFAAGQYEKIFQALPYQHLIDPQPYPLRLRHSIKGYMLKPFIAQD